MRRRSYLVLFLILSGVGVSCVIWKGFKTAQSSPTDIATPPTTAAPTPIVESTPIQEPPQTVPAAAEPWQPLTREELNTQLEDLFGEPGSERSKLPWTPEELTDEALQFKLAELTYRLTYATNDGVDLRNLEDYGLIVNKDGTVTIDYNQNPKWSNVTNTMVFFSTDGGRAVWLMNLESHGFSESEIREVQERAMRNPMLQVRERSLQALTQFANDAQGPLPLDRLRQLAYKMDFEFNMSMQKPRIQWAIGILAPLDRAKKETLVNLARQSQSFSSTMTPRDRNSDADGAIQSAKSGDLMRRIQSAMSTSEERP